MPDNVNWEEQAIRNEKAMSDFREARDAGREPPRVLILVHHRGRKTGTERVTPLAYLDLGGSWAIFASRAGTEVNPDWYLNLVAHSRVTVEVGGETLEVTARTAEGAERERIWEAQKEAVPRFAEYEIQAAPRQIPVMILEPIG
jgi:deazaflavin-dependent oxidoreductase (nitroreductase family)